MNDYDEGTDLMPAESRPYERAFDKALKEVAVLREQVVRLRDQIKPALQPEVAEKSDGGVPADASPAPKSAVVRDFDNLGYEIGKLTTLVQSISHRVYL